MSPEQAAGLGVSDRSDLYSIGVVMLEMLTNTNPYEGEDIQGILHRIIGTDLPRASELIDVSSELEEFIVRCVDRNPENRYDSAGAALAALPPSSKPMDLVTLTDLLSRAHVTQREADTIISDIPEEPVESKTQSILGDLPPKSKNPRLRIYGADIIIFHRELTESQILVGRHFGSDLLLDYPGVSRYHATLRREGDGYVVEDINSANGLLVNSALVTDSYHLVHGDVITVGPASLQYITNEPEEKLFDLGFEDEPARLPIAPIPDEIAQS